VHQEVGEQRTAEEQDTLSDTLRPVTQVPLTTRDALNTITNLFIATAIYRKCLTIGSHLRKERKKKLSHESNHCLSLVYVNCIKSSKIRPTNDEEIKMKALILFFQILTCSFNAAVLNP